MIFSWKLSQIFHLCHGYKHLHNNNYCTIYITSSMLHLREPLADFCQTSSDVYAASLCTLGCLLFVKFQSCKASLARQITMDTVGSWSSQHFWLRRHQIVHKTMEILATIFWLVLGNYFRQHIYTTNCVYQVLIYAMPIFRLHSIYPSIRK
jgi:hypothetical protein